MEKITIKAHAKINLALDILGKRDDGYHEIRTVMQSLALHDVLQIKKVYKKNYLKIVTNLRWLPTDERNLVYRACAKLIELYNIPCGVFVELTKNISVSAGMAGGSTDCAAALLGMRKLFNLPVTDIELAALAKSFGADVPYCLKGGTALAEGIGENLTILPDMPKMYVLIAKPPVIVSTGDVFKRFSIEQAGKRPDINKMLQALNDRNTAEIAANMANVLESVTETMYPVITDLKCCMMRNKAAGAMMTGSGPTVFGLFLTNTDASEALRVIESEFPSVREIKLTTTEGVLSR